LAQADAERGALDQDRLLKIRDAVSEFAGDISERDDDALLNGNLTTDAEASSAIESVSKNAPNESLPVLSKQGLPPDWQGDHPILCIAGRSLVDEAGAALLAQLSTAHGLAARVEGAEALSMTNVLRLDPVGVTMACLIYVGSSGDAHMRYAVRRLRRRIPRATIMLVCCTEETDETSLKLVRESSKADLAAATIGDAVKLCLEAAQAAGYESKPADRLEAPVVLERGEAMAT
jgi:hypothetical protein